MFESTDLVEEWRRLAGLLREHHAPQSAIAYERCAEQLEARLEEHGSEPLTLQEASELSGYSSDHLGRLVREGKIPNAGRHGAPRIRRADVPVKPQSRELPLAEETPRGHHTGRQIVQSIIEEGAA